MTRPICPRHPRARVKRDGYYGKHKQFVRWKCAGSATDRPHLIRADLSTRVVGGLHGACDACERPWSETDGLPQAVGDRFALRHKAQALVRLGRGESYRQVGWEARRAVRPGRRNYSPDWRAGGDWVSQYTPIVAKPFLPTSWPASIAVDAFEVRVPRLRPNGTPVQRGADHYAVLAVVGYERPRTSEPGKVWALRAVPEENAQAWYELFSSLEGEPEVIVADRGLSSPAAATTLWPEARQYLSTWHLLNSCRVHVKRAKLGDNTELLWRLLTDETFTSPEAYVAFRLALHEYRERRPRDVHLRKMENSLNTSREAIWQTLTEPHRPLSTGAVEDALDQVKRKLGDRARKFFNLPRLNHLLTLMQLQMVGHADEATYARLLRENHERHRGQPPPRRLHDGAGLRP